MRIETERLILRPFQEGDAEDLFDYLFKEFISFVKNPDGTPHYENTYQYAILKKEWDT